ncbi:hypothetical protein ACP4OV_004909 [Aristida adscensionis]
MAVYFRYRSGVETFSVPVAVPAVSVADLKRLIMGTARHGHGRARGRGPRESVALSDARTGEEYGDDAAMVPRGSTVLVRRVAGPPAETITVASSLPPSSPKAMRDDTSSGSAVGGEVDEDRAIRAVIDAAQLKWDDHPYPHGPRGAQVWRTPPPGYVCHRCRVAGHFIQHCPTNGDPRFDFRRAAASTSTALPAAAPVSPSPDDGVPPELHCRICKKVMADAVVTSRCCFDSFCDGCIRGHIADKSQCVCGARARSEDLIPNHTLRATISNMLATTAAATATAAAAGDGGASGGTINTRSSAAGSNTEYTSQSPAAASQESRSHVTAGACSEQSDGSASSTSKRAAGRDPRTKQATAASPEVVSQSHAGYPGQYGYGAPYGPACYDPFFGAAPWPCDPSAFYGVPHGGGYPTVPVPAGYHDGRHGRKRTADEYRGHEEPGFKRRHGSRSVSAA